MQGSFSNFAGWIFTIHTTPFGSGQSFQCSICLRSGIRWHSGKNYWNNELRRVCHLLIKYFACISHKRQNHPTNTEGFSTEIGKKLGIWVWKKIWSTHFKTSFHHSFYVSSHNFQTFATKSLSFGIKIYWGYLQI